MNQRTTNNRKIQVLFIGLKYDYGYPDRGYSYEYVNFYDTLLHMENVAVTLFPFDEVMRKHGRDDMNRQLLDAVTRAKADVCFFMLFTDEIKKQTIETIQNQGKTVIVNWFTDDHWRFEEYSQQWAPLFHWVVTTDQVSIEKYRRMGHNNVILSQWGANHFLYKHFDVPTEYGVTFVGQVHSNRENIVNKLKRSGIGVECWGKGWPNGRLSQEEMIKVFSKSKINLNFSESSIAFNAKQIAKIFLRRRADDTFRVKNPNDMLSFLTTMLHKHQSQIKGRNFEIPMAGGFLLTQYVDGIENYFLPGKEIETFESKGELCDKIRYYLTHDKERELIRQAGYERAVREHTLKCRFDDIFQIILSN
jgi:spore maturation protein CgeB